MRWALMLLVFKSIGHSEIAPTSVLEYYTVNNLGYKSSVIVKNENNGTYINGVRVNPFHMPLLAQSLQKIGQLSKAIDVLENCRAGNAELRMRINRKKTKRSVCLESQSFKPIAKEIDKLLHYRRLSLAAGSGLKSKKTKKSNL